MLSYGIPAALLIIVPFTLLIGSACKKIILNSRQNYNEIIFEKAWLVSIILLALTHLVDITYFDGRISIAGWILLAGVRNINKENLIHIS